MSLIGYARVSTLEQDPALQIDALEKAGCARVDIYIDHASGSLDSRPQLDRLMAAIRPGDTLVVWKLDRLARSLAHAANLLKDFQARGIHFRSLQDGIDTSTAFGRAAYGMAAVFAQLELDLIRERTRAGLAAARARGRLGGRKPKVNGGADAQMRRLYEGGTTLQEIASMFRVSRSTVQRHLEKTA